MLQDFKIRCPSWGGTFLRLMELIIGEIKNLKYSLADIRAHFNY